MLRMIDAVASGTNEVDGIELPYVGGVVEGQRCQVLKQGDAPGVILPLGGWSLLDGVTKSDASGWSVTAGNVWRSGGLLWFPQITIERTGTDFTNSGGTVVTTFSAPAALLSASSTRQALAFATSTPSGTRPLIGCYYDADSGELSVRVPNTVTWATNAVDVFTGMVPIL